MPQVSQELTKAILPRYNDKDSRQWDKPDCSINGTEENTKKQANVTIT